ncbi:transglutaminase domain-containing protein [Paenibacillus ginsengarvi]|uniref:Transglutaminase domain-containing protein n=2 Tax=Paenibacillus ginsengarvi TaxID=400777 RepID=A0A3B0C580_9BACL|nr:transglutaminase-like domain-containing protein [Paenibacillus ginsengarvi]RKN80732.1 transglutaminase domain-containing protein [Paenibacillus ginsengarvi]
MANSAWLLEQVSVNLVSLVLVCIVIASVIQGAVRGASGSAQRFMQFAAEGVATVVSVVVAWKLADTLSPQLQSWLVAKRIVIPNEEIGFFQQMLYTFVTGVRDFPLLRVGTVFAIAYLACKTILVRLWLFIALRTGLLGSIGSASRSWMSSGVGGAIGSLIGCGRALLLIACLFVYTALYPETPFTNYVKSSGLYMQGATQVIEPVGGELLASRLPVFAKAVGDEFNHILQRKYEVIDARIPSDIAEAAKQIAAPHAGDEAKAKALYQWVGSRVQYDYDKVQLYEEKRIWKEQSPEETFATRKGVCIDYSRLYAVMARSVGLDVKVVTGLGYDGQGGYGPHAWNEVYLADSKEWVPLDSTWMSSGGNWFDPPGFDKTHIRDA